MNSKGHLIHFHNERSTDTRRPNMAHVAVERANARIALQHRHDLFLECAGQRVRAPPPPRGLLLRGKRRVPVDPAAAAGAEAGLRGRRFRRVRFRVFHERPHLVVRCLVTGHLAFLCSRMIARHVPGQPQTQKEAREEAKERRAVDSEPPRQLRLRNALPETALQQHLGLPSVHPCPFPSVVTSSPQRPGASPNNKPKLLHFRLPQMLESQVPPTPLATCTQRPAVRERASGLDPDSSGPRLLARLHATRFRTVHECRPCRGCLLDFQW